MISNGKALFKHVNTLLSKEGFLKRKDTWYKPTEDCITFFSISKSPYGGKYNHVFGLFLKALHTTGKEFPVFYKNDFKVHLNDFADRDLVERAFNLENQDFTGEERESILAELFDLYVIPFLSSLGTQEGIRKIIADKPGFIHRMNLNTRELLGLKETEGS